MLHEGKNWFTAGTLVLACFAAAGANLHAGEKKQDSIFKGATKALSAKDGKVRHEGELDADTPSVQNHYYRAFTFKMDAGKSYRIDHMSSDFDAFLFLEDPTGKKITQDDDGGDGLNSRIIYKAPKTGDYRVVATSLKTKETGKFTLEIKPASPAEEKEAVFIDQVTRFAEAAPAEQKKILGAALKHFQDKGAKLGNKDAMLAFQLTNALEDADPTAAKATYKDLIKVFASAENPQVAGIAKAFEGSLKKLDLLGKEFAISGKTVEGKEFDLKNLKGKVVLVDFWATWCGPCIAEIPNMEDAYKKYKGKGFEIIGVSLDRTDAAIVKFNEERKIPWASINIEDSRKLADLYEVNAIPFPVLVDEAGRVVSFRARGPQLERLLEKMLGEKK